MKKNIVVIIIAFMAVCLQSAQIQWGASGLMYYNGTAMGNANFTVTGYLVYLGGTGATFASDFTVTSATSITLGGDVLKTANNNSLGQMMPTGATALTGLTPGTTLIGKNGDLFQDDVSTFGIIFIAVHKDWDSGEFAWAISDPFVYSQSAPATGGTIGNWTAGSSTFSYASTIAGNGKNNWNFVTIPEPATTGLALAGLALLFRRKRK